MSTYHLAIDIGASSGRHILSYIEDGKMVLKEVYRFANGMVESNGHQCWDIEQLFTEIINGMKCCKELDMIPVTMAIDTWAVDYALLDDSGDRITDVYAYRDSRTNGMDQLVYQIISEEKLYEKTGIQKQIFNTIYQLMAVKEQMPQVFNQAKTMLMIPDYMNYRLTGHKVTEYTNATTTQLVSLETNDWDYDLIKALGYPTQIFTKIVMPGTSLGDLHKEIQDIVGFTCNVIVPATHDTGSAVMAVPTNEEHTVYISSGTWSLMGTELQHANSSEKSKELNFTNEGGYDHRFRFLKNIMGLWMIQSVKKELGDNLSFAHICEGASKESITSIVDCNDNRFLAPLSMTTQVQEACRESNQQVPEGIYQVAAVVYNSLAYCYARTIEQIEQVTGQTYASIHVVGGGANADYLNQLTARETKKVVYAGPTEATAIGNLVAQYIATGEIKDLKEARDCIYNSFDIKKYCCCSHLSSEQ